MKKKFLAILILLCSLCTLFAFAACNNSVNTGDTGNGGNQTEQPGGEEQPEQPDDEEPEPHVHDFKNYVYNNDATCTEDGTKTGTCSCGAKDTRIKFNSALGHTFEVYVSNGDATCLQNGTETAACIRCSEQDTREAKDSALGHDWDDGQITTPATCTTPGVRTFTCNRDSNHHKTEEIQIDPTAHEYGEWIPQIDAECEKDGVLGHFECEYCHENFDEDYEHLDSLKINQLGHKYSDTLDHDRYTHFKLCEYCNEKVEIGYHGFGDNKTCATCQYVADYTLGLAFELNGDGATCALTGIGTASDANIVIPDQYYDEETNALYPVTEVIPRVFENRTVNSIVVPDSVTAIAQGAFTNCMGLTSITLPFVGKSPSASAHEGVLGYVFNYVIRTQSSEKVENATYQYYASSQYYYYFIPQTLTSVTISSGTINSNAFYNCANLTKVTLGEGVTSIGSNAFYNCANLTEVTLGEGVTSIDSDAFSNCDRLLTMHIPASLTYISSSAFTNCNSLQSFTVAEGNRKYVAYDGIIYDYNVTTSVVIPKDLRGNVKLHPNINRIGSRAFEGRTNLTGIFMENVDTIEERAFYGCTSLTTLALPAGLTKIANYTFYNCENLNDVTIPDGVTIIGDYAFYGCSAFTKLNIPQNVEAIGEAAFAYCGFDTVSVSNRNVSFKAAGNCLVESMTNILICGSNSGELPDGITEIKAYAFSGCSFTEITVPDTVQKIGGSAFSGCSALQRMTLPFVGSGKDATEASSQTLFGYIFGSNQYDGGAATEQQYYASYWSVATYYIPTSLKSVTITGGDILYGAFEYCSGLESVTIGSVTSIGSYAFYNCTNLTGITIPETVTSIGNGAFRDCSSLESVTIPETVTSIGNYAFGGCSGLENITIPGSVTSIGDGAFEDCSGLANVTFANPVGWKVSRNSDMSDSTAFDNLDDSRQNAKYLTNIYKYYYWKREG